MDPFKKEESDEADLSEYDKGPPGNQDDEERSESSISRSSRGRAPIPEQWTRVISLKNDNLENLRVYPIATDLHLAPHLPTGLSPRRPASWKPVFFT